MIEVPFIPDADVRSAASLQAVADTLPAHAVACCNWPDAYPYVPETALRLFHAGSHLILDYTVREQCTAAHVREDLGEVWTDSCCEFFLQPRGTGNYYNIEATCIGRILIGWRPGREGAVHAPQALLDKVLRYPSLGREPFEEKVGDNRWRLTLAIPAEALFADALTTFSGLEARFNCYKCGDHLSQPHYVSLAPIATPAPDFHRPEYFTEIKFL
jgi:hypothetical protein